MKRHQLDKKKSSSDVLANIDTLFTDEVRPELVIIEGQLSDHQRPSSSNAGASAQTVSVMMPEIDSPIQTLRSEEELISPVNDFESLA